MKIELTIRLTRAEKKALKECCKRRGIGRGFYTFGMLTEQNNYWRIRRGRIGANAARQRST